VAITNCTVQVFLTVLGRRARSSIKKNNSCLEQLIGSANDRGLGEVKSSTFLVLLEIATNML
jgi:hypothetical protein